MNEKHSRISRKQISPIFNIPVETLCTIFRLVCGVPGDSTFTESDRGDLRYSRRALALTCVNWNTIVADDKNLWNTIFICEVSTVPTVATQMEVINSGTSLLRIIVSVGTFFAWGGLPIASYLSNLREHIGSLSIGWNCSMEFLATVGLEDDGNEWADLSSLSLIMSAGRISQKKPLFRPTINLSSRSSLKELKLATEKRDKSFNSTISLWHVIPPTSNNITHLAVRGYFDANNVIAAINACSMLEKLAWGGPRPNESTFSRLQPLINLRELHLEAHFPPNFLHFFQCPNLELLELDEYIVNPSDQLSDVTFPKLRTFVFTSEWGSGVMNDFLLANSSLEEIIVLGNIGESWLECINDLKAFPNLRHLAFYERDRMRKKIEKDYIEGFLRTRTRFLQSPDSTKPLPFRMTYFVHDGTGQGRKNGLAELSRKYPMLTCMNDS